MLITSLRDCIKDCQITGHSDRLNNISFRLLRGISLLDPRPALLITDDLDACQLSDNSTCQEHCDQSQVPGFLDGLLNNRVMLPTGPSTVPFHSHHFPVSLAKTIHDSDCASAATDCFDSDSIVVKCPLNAQPPNLCNRMIKSTCRMDIRDDLLPVLPLGIGEQCSSDGIVGQSAPQETWSRGRGVVSVEQEQVRHAGRLESVTRESLTDMVLVASGSDVAEHIATALKPPISPFLVRKVRTFPGLPGEKVVDSVDGLGVPFVPTRRGFLYVLERNLAKALLELVQGLAKLVWGCSRLVGWNRATGSLPSSCGTAKHTLPGALQAKTVGMLCSEALHSMVLTSALRTTCGPRVRIRAVANVHSPSVSTATYVQRASGSPILPGFVAEAGGGPGNAILVTAGSAGGAPTTAARTVPPPADAQLPTDGVGLERDQLFEGNEEYYGEDRGGAGQGGDADETEMAQEAREQQSGAREEEDKEERAKLLHVVESAEKDTTDTDGAAK